MRALIPFLLVLAACAPRRDVPPARDPEPARARAALAALQVANNTADTLRIFYRHSTRATGEVGIGQALPGASPTMAPVPAGEPIVLIARNSADHELVMPARTFVVQGSWLWNIPADARFTARAGGTH